MAKFSGSLDANVLLRLLLDDIPEQHEAAVKLLENSKRPYFVADAALIELVFALEKHYRFKRSAIQEAVEGLLSLPTITADRTLADAALPLFVKNGTLSFEDACLLAYAERSGALPLWTFDKKLAARSEKARQVSSIYMYQSYELT